MEIDEHFGMSIVDRVLVLYYDRSVNARDISKLVGISTNEVSGILHRYRVQRRSRLGEVDLAKHIGDVKELIKLGKTRAEIGKLGYPMVVIERAAKEFSLREEFPGDRTTKTSGLVSLLRAGESVGAIAKRLNVLQEDVYEMAYELLVKAVKTQNKLYTAMCLAGLEEEAELNNPIKINEEKRTVGAVSSGGKLRVYR